MISKIDKRKRRAKKTRAKIKELEAHRLSIHRSSNHIYAQIIAPDDKTIAATSSLDPEVKKILGDKIKGKIEIAKAVGQQIAEKAKKGHLEAQRVMNSWANAEWFTSKPELSNKLTVSVFKVPGETNTDDLSPAQDAWSRPDIPFHAKAMYKNPRDGITNAEEQINKLEEAGFPVALVGDVMGTGSSRKSATNSVLWYIGDDLPHIPNKRDGGVCIGGKIAPIFFNTMEDAGALPFECDVDGLNTGDIIDIDVYAGKITRHDTNELITEFELKTEVLLDEVRAGGRIPLIIGRGLTQRARDELELAPSDIFRLPIQGQSSDKGVTLAQ